MPRPVSRVSLFAGLMGILSWASAEPLQSIEAIRALDVETAAQQLPVELESQVVWVDPIRNACFLYDGKNGIYVRGKRPYDHHLDLKPGSLVRVTGFADAGNFSSSIVDADFVILGEAPLPEPKAYNSEQLLSPLVDCDWVTLSARIVGMEVVTRDFSNERYIMVEVRRNNYSLNVQLPYTKESEERISEIMFAWVRFNAVAGTVYNDQRQAAGRLLFASSADDFVPAISDELLARAGETRPLADFMIDDTEYLYIVNSSGVVTFVGDQEVFLRDGDSAVRVRVPSSEGIEVGERVYIEGFISPGEVSPGFRARLVLNLEKNLSPEPIPFDGSGELSTRYNFELVEVEGTLVDLVKVIEESENEIGQNVLICRTGDRLFETRVPLDVDLPKKIEPGARLRIVGICHLIRNEHVPLKVELEGFWLQVRGAEGIEIIATAPWWTVAKVLWIAGGVFVIAISFFVWVILLRRTVGQQTKVIADQVEQETILNERQRMARELHDNLDQGLTGAAVHLQAGRKFLDTSNLMHLEAVESAIQMAGETNPDLKDRLQEHMGSLREDTGKTLTSLQSVQAMLRHCGEESRTSILELRGGLLERMDLPSALRESLQLLADECGAECRIDILGNPRRLKQRAERHLLMIAREAVTNAVRHAAPGTLTVELEYRDNSLRLLIRDDGRGFEKKSLSKSGHFGIRGMEERVNRLDGSISIESRPEAGTTISVEIDNLSQWELIHHE
ncbi:MAG: sensor histidine kinase [Verrucomicrobiota bacterium]